MARPSLSLRYPATMRTTPAQRSHYRRPATFLEETGRLICSRLTLGTGAIGLRPSIPKHIVIPLHGADFIAVQVRPITSEGDEIPHSLILLRPLTVTALPPYDMIAGNNGPF